mmetsp:Transcript_22673/g.34869  ORF Transcript_22673/g.34869 Transcript_22673/m.34869 type:complete len:168 (+) Transcript_22673:73-576(+)
MKRHHQTVVESESSSDEEDAFTKIASKKNSGNKQGDPAENTTNKRQRSSSTSNESSATTTTCTKTASTSSNKRHHGTSAARKAKLDAILQDLQTTEVQLRPEYRGGSFVEPEEEHLTTNVFVGNLDPGVTEEALTDLFRQFGMCVCRVFVLFCMLDSFVRSLLQVLF